MIRSTPQRSRSKPPVTLIYRHRAVCAEGRSMAGVTTLNCPYMIETDQHLEAPSLPSSAPRARWSAPAGCQRPRVTRNSNLSELPVNALAQQKLLR